MRPIIFCDYSQGYKMEKFIAENLADLKKNGYEKFMIDSLPDGNAQDVISRFKMMINIMDQLEVSSKQAYNEYTAMKNDIHYILHATKLADANGIKVIPVVPSNMYDKILTFYQQNQGVFVYIGADSCNDHKDDYLFKEAIFVFSKDDFTKVTKLRSELKIDTLIVKPLPKAVFIENFNSINDIIGDMDNNIDELWW